MSMKKILMAAVAVTALTAGSASAITISKTASTMGTGSITLTPTSVTGGSTTEPYTIASEVAAPTTAVVSSIVATLTEVLTSGTSYVVTYTVTNGTFGNSASELGVIASGNITALDNAGTPAAVALAPALGTITSTQAQFVITPAAANAKTLT